MVKLSRYDTVIKVWAHPHIDGLRATVAVWGVWDLARVAGVAGVIDLAKYNGRRDGVMTVFKLCDGTYTAPRWHPFTTWHIIRTEEDTPANRRRYGIPPDAKPVFRLPKETPFVIDRSSFIDRIKAFALSLLPQSTSRKHSPTA